MRFLWFCLLLSFVVCVQSLMMWARADASRAHFTQDNFVRLIEAREGIVPGQTRVIPDCSCTVRYVGTQVSGNRYKVVFDKLD